MFGYLFYPGVPTKKILKLNSVRKSVTMRITFFLMKNTEYFTVRIYYSP